MISSEQRDLVPHICIFFWNSLTLNPSTCSSNSVFFEDDQEVTWLGISKCTIALEIRTCVSLDDRNDVIGEWVMMFPPRDTI